MVDSLKGEHTIMGYAAPFVQTLSQCQSQCITVNNR